MKPILMLRWPNGHWCEVEDGKRYSKESGAEYAFFIQATKPFTFKDPIL